MGEHKEYLNGNVYNNLEVIGYDKEKSKKRDRPYYLCRCQLCNKEASYPKKKLIAGECSCECSSTSDPIEKNEIN